MDNVPTVSIRVKCRTGQHVLKELSLGLTVSQLRDKLYEISNVKPADIKVLHGYPPRPLDLSQPDEKLTSLNLRSGDTLIVEEILTTTERTANNVSESNAAQNTSSSQVKSSDELAASHILEQVLHTSQSADGSSGEQGILTRKIVPPNNSCLFTSIDYAMRGGRAVDLASSLPMRRLVADIVSHDPVTYNEGFLGQSNESYCRWIMDEKSWGGAIEVSILAKHYQTEIAVLDAQSGRIDRFGETEHYPQRVFLFYDGTHYDPLAYENTEGTRVLRTRFSTQGDADVLSQALDIASEARASRQFTDLHAGMMQCRDCGVMVRGEEEMMKHSKATAHVRYSEVKASTT